MAVSNHHCLACPSRKIHTSSEARFPVVLHQRLRVTVAVMGAFRNVADSLLTSLEMRLQAQSDQDLILIANSLVRQAVFGFLCSTGLGLALHV